MSKFMASVLTLFVAAMFGSLLGAQTTPNLFWFRFEETSGSSSTNQATLAGSMFGGFTVTTSGLFTDGMGLASPPRIQPGAVGSGAVNLFGVSAWLDTGLPGTTLNASSFTVECWVNTNNVSQEGNAVFSICTNTAANVTLYIASANNRLALEVNGSIAATSTTGTINDGNWHHVALVYDRTAQTATGFVDAVQVFQATAQNYTLSAGSNVCFFNGRTTSSFGKWSGRADEARMHSSALSSTQFASTLAPVSPTPSDGGSDEEGCTTADSQGYGFALLAVAALLAMSVRIRRRSA